MLMSYFSFLFVLVASCMLHLHVTADDKLKLWISSFQDQTYYEQMAELYAKKSGKKVSLEVEAYGFREMPDKLGAVMRTGEGAPDLVQLDETCLLYTSPSPRNRQKSRMPSSA